MPGTPAGAVKALASRLGLEVIEIQQRRASGLKWCYRCRDWRKITSFGWDRSRYDGLASSCLAHRRVLLRKSTKGRTSTFKGRRHTAHARLLISLAKKGKPSPKRGIPRTPEERRRISAAVRVRALRGAACPAWKGGITPVTRLLRKGSAYKDWRRSVFERDEYACQDCGDRRGGNLRAHHLREWATHPELRFDVDNGVTLCVPCHKARHAAPR